MAPVARQIESLRAAGVEVDLLELRGLRKLKYLRAMPELWAKVHASDLVHAHFGYCGWLGRLQFVKPVIVSFMGDDLLGTPDACGRISARSKLIVLIDRWLARVVDAVIVKSAEMAQVVAPVRAHVVPNGIDLQLFRPIEGGTARAQLGWAQGKHYVLFPGDPDNPRKGFGLAQAAVAEAAQHLAAPIELVPLWNVKPERVPLYMNACHALLMTSFVEGSPNAVKEALACNLPVVGVPVGDLPELLAGVSPGAVCQRAAPALGAALAQVITQAQRSDGRVALKRKQLDIHSVAHQLLRIYQDVLARNST